MNKYDYIILGSGIAGLYASLLAKEQGSVLILTKGSLDDCNTKQAQGGIAAALDKNDSPELHFRDTIAAGAGLCDTETVRILAEEASERIADLIGLGVPFDTLDGQIALAKEAAHSMPRIVHAGGDATGEHIELTLSQLVRQSKIKILEHCLATEILTDQDGVRGVRALDCRTGSVVEFDCSFLILATGGAGRLFRFTTNSDIATGDGVALAYEAGAEISDMEFFQFHPTALRLPGVTPFLISEAVRGEGGILRNVEGEAFMYNYTPEGELASRDIVARSILYEMRKNHSERVFLDITHLPPHRITTRFPHIYRFCRDHGLDITKGPIPVAPAAHYMMGGVRTSTWGESNIPCLFAIGEVACTGVHGANRLASNSMLEVIVFTKRTIEKAKDTMITSRPIPEVHRSERYGLPERQPLANVSPPSLAAIQSLMWEKVGIVRSKETLEEAANILATWQKTAPQPTDRPSYELSNLILTARLMTEAALTREESRGAHFRTDFPHPSQQWIKHIVFRKPS